MIACGGQVVEPIQATLESGQLLASIGMIAICARQLFCEGMRFGDLMPRLLGNAAACDQLFQTVVGAAVEIADKLGEAEQK